MAEKLNSHTEIVLFGKVVEDLGILSKDSSNKTKIASSQKFIRVFGFSFNGIYTEMGSATLFAVSGNGTAAKDVKVPGPKGSDAFVKDLRAWTCNRSDDAMRLDIDSGTYDEILIEGAAEEGMGVSGARVSGARVSGARVSGARVSGARVSGARVSGARVSGARLSGED